MGLNLERVLYTSRARGNADNLMMQVEILAVSQRNNARDGLTGALMIHDGRFLQVLEGAAQDLDRLMRRLADDPAALDAALQGAAVAYFSGITVAILSSQGRANLLAALARARASGARIVFDPNLRPRLWTDTNTMHQGISDAAAGADLVLPSFDDEATHFGDADPQATVARYLALGAGQVVVKNGGGPISFGGAGGSGVIDDLAPETPVDSTAAGDSFNAGYLAASLSGADCAAAIAAGHDLSRKVIRHRGALVQQAVAEKA